MKSLLVATALVVLAELPAYPAEPASFPPPIGGPRAVSEGTLGPAVGFQGHPHIASNGDVAIAMWGDSKGEWWGTRVSPIDSNGNVLDPVGTLINDGGYPEGIYWNGTEFVAMTIDGSKRTRVRLTPEGQVIDSVVLGMPVGFNLAAVSDDGQRLLFVEWTGTRAALADKHGEMAGEPVSLAPLPDGSFSRSFFGAARNGEFLVARYVHKEGSWSTLDLIADRIDSSGRLVSSVRTKLPVEFNENHVMVGGGDGYLVVAQNPAVIAYRLDAAGVFTGTAITLVADDPDLRHIGYRPAVVRDGSQFLVAWHMSFNHGESDVRIASIPDGASSVTETHRVGLWPGISGGIALAAKETQIVALASVNVLDTITGPDLYSIRISPALTGDAPRLVAQSASAQRMIEAAAGENGFAIVWMEDGPDFNTHVMVRRVSRSGAPQSQPVEVSRVPATAYGVPYVQVAVASNGSAYLIAWSESGTLKGRRMAALTGEWLDAAPFAIGNGNFVPNGLAVGNAEAALAYVSGDVIVQRICFSGEPVTSAATVIEADIPYSAALAANGDGYLVVWSEGFRGCNFDPCVIEPFRLLASRIGSGGARLDIAPIVLEDRVSDADRPAAAWGGDRYLVVWNASWEHDEHSLRGATLTRDGVVVEGNPPSSAGIGIEPPGAPEFHAPRLVSHGNDFVLVDAFKSYGEYESRLEGMKFRFDTPLRSLETFPRVTLRDGLPGWNPAFALAADDDGRLLLGCIRESNEEDGGAPRAFFQILGEQERRRPVRQ